MEVVNGKRAVLTAKRNYANSGRECPTTITLWPSELLMGSLPPTANGLASPLAAQRNGEKPIDLNIRKVVLGDILFDPWYPSFYPEELVGREVERLNVCQWCFKYSKDLVPYLAHIVRKHSL